MTNICKTTHPQDATTPELVAYQYHGSHAADEDPADYLRNQSIKAEVIA
ncbi:hypothetical protein [Salibacterium salarium]|nr:hypothetical protein [Salibacterium salarium]